MKHNNKFVQPLLPFPVLIDTGCTAEDIFAYLQKSLPRKKRNKKSFSGMLGQKARYQQTYTLDCPSGTGKWHVQPTGQRSGRHFFDLLFERNPYFSDAA